MNANANLSPFVPSDPRFALRPPDRHDQRGLIASVPFAAGASMISFGAQAVHRRPSRLTVQVSEDEHIDLDPEFLALTNHSCDPNVQFDVERRALVALRDIAPGEELAFFYPANEWRMATPFDCHCGAAQCLGPIAGAIWIEAATLARYRLAPHIRRLLDGRGPSSTGRRA